MDSYFFLPSLCVNMVSLTYASQYSCYSRCIGTQLHELAITAQFAPPPPGDLVFIVLTGACSLSNLSLFFSPRLTGPQLVVLNYACSDSV